MLWSPVVKNQRAGSKHNQLNDVTQVVATIERECGIVIETRVNDSFAEGLQELREVAARETKELDSSVMRFLQLEAYLERHRGRKASSSRSSAHTKEAAVARAP